MLAKSKFKFETGDQRYFLTCLGWITCSILIAICASAALFHFVFRHEITKYVATSSARNVNSMLSDLFDEKTEYIKAFFFDVSKAAEIFNRYLMTYSSYLLNKAHSVEDVFETVFQKFAVWTAEHFIIFSLLTILIILIMYRMA